MSAATVPARWLRLVLPAAAPVGRRARWALAAVVVVGAVLRIVWATRMHQPVTFRDPAAYLLLGQQLAGGEGYTYPTRDGDSIPTAYFPPGYPLALAAVLTVAKLVPVTVSAFGIGLAFNVVLSVLLIPLVFLLGHRLAGDRVGVIAAAFVAGWPNLVFHSGVLLTETLFLVLLVTLLLVLLATPAVARRPGPRRLVTVGLLLGAVVLVRPVSVVVAPLVLLLWWPDGVAAAVRRTALVAAVTIATLVPWAVLSTVRMESPVLLSLNFGDNLCISYADTADGGFTMPGECELLSEGDGRASPTYETRRQARNIERAIGFVRDDPGRAVGLIPARLRFTLRDDADGLVAASDYGARPVLAPPSADRADTVADVYYYVLAALAVVGLVVLVRSGRWADRRWRLLVLSAPVSLLSPLLTFGDPRFKMPVYPALALCAALGVATLRRRHSTAGAARAADAARAGRRAATAA